MVVFRGDVNHAGAGYKCLNYRIQVALTVKGVVWEKNITQQTKRVIGVCKYCLENFILCKSQPDTKEIFVK